jgi:hypothetical protein
MHRSRALSITGCLLGVLALASGCGGSSPAARKPAETPATGEPGPGAPAEPTELAPQEAPDALLAVAVAAHPVGQFRGLAELAEAVQPGAGAAMEANAFVEQLTSDFGGLPASAFDLEKPLYLLMLHEQASPLVLVAAIADREALTKGLGEGVAMRVQRGYAAIGSPEALEAVAGYALTRLREEPLSSALTIALRFEQLMQRYAGELITGLRSLPAAAPDVRTQKLLELYASLLEAVSKQIKTLRFALEPSAAGLTVHIALDAVPDTTLAAFTRAQTASDFALTREVVIGEDDFFLGGRLDYSAFPSLLDETWAQLLGATLDEASATDAVRAHMRRWFGLMGGEIAMGGRFDEKERTSLRMHVRVSDEAEARALLTEWLDLIKRYPAAYKYRKPRVQSTRAQGVQLHTITAEFAGTPEEQQMMEKFYGPKLTSAIAVASGRLSMAMGQDAQRQLRELLGRKPAADEHPAVADARARGESMLVYMDLAGLMSRALGKSTPARTQPGITMGLGFSDGTADWRITVPTAQILGAMAVAQSP